MPSPFTNTAMILDRRYFFGRAEQLDRIFDRLNGVQAGSVNIVGERRIGRSSLLWHVAAVQNERLLQPDAFAFVYVDLQSDQIVSPETFRRFVMDKLGSATPPGGQPVTATQFDDALADCRARGFTPVLLLDELEALLKPTRTFDADFFDGLRSKGNAGLAAYVIATRSSLAHIETTWPKLSKLHGICERVDLGGFLETEAHTLLSQPSEFTLQLAQIALARSWAGLHPLRLNLAAHQLYVRLQRNNGAWHNADADAAFKAYTQHEQYIFSGHRPPIWKRAAHAARRSAGAIIDGAEARTWMTRALMVGLGLFVLLVIGWITLPQVRDAVLRMFGVPAPTPTP